PQQGWPGGGGQETRGIRRPPPLWQAVASAPTRGDDTDGVHGTVVWDAAGAGSALASSYPVSILEPRAPPREGLAPGQPRQLCDAAQEPAPRSYTAHPGDGYRSDRACLELSGVYLAADASRPSPYQADRRTPCTSADPSPPGSG